MLFLGRNFISKNLKKSSILTQSLMARAICLWVVLFISSCAVVKNYPQESQYMKVIGGGMIMDSGDIKYGVSIRFKALPTNAKYLIADFEIPNSPGMFDRKVFKISKGQLSAVANSDKIYGYEFGLYYAKLSLSEDKSGDHIIDSLEQSVKLFKSPYNRRDYAAQYAISKNSEEVKKLLVIFPSNRNKKLISAELPSDYHIGHAGVGKDESIIEYVPIKETVFNWSKIVTILENKNFSESNNKPYIFSGALGDGMFKKFSDTDKNIQVFYEANHNGEIVNSNEAKFRGIVSDADVVSVYVDYADRERIKKYPNQREFLVARSIRSDVSVWQLQCTIRYDKTLSAEKIKALKEEAKSIVSSFGYVSSNPINIFQRSDEYEVQIQRLDESSMNEKYNTDLKLKSKKSKL